MPLGKGKQNVLIKGCTFSGYLYLSGVQHAVSVYLSNVKRSHVPFLFSLCLLASFSSFLCLLGAQTWNSLYKTVPHSLFSVHKPHFSISGNIPLTLPHSSIDSLPRWNFSIPTWYFSIYLYYFLKLISAEL